MHKRSKSLVEAISSPSIREGHGGADDDIVDARIARGVESGGRVTRASMGSMSKWMEIEDDANVKLALHLKVSDDIIEGRQCEHSKKDSKSEENRRGGPIMLPIPPPIEVANSCWQDLGGSRSSIHD